MSQKDEDERRLRDELHAMLRPTYVGYNPEAVALAAVEALDKVAALAAGIENDMDKGMGGDDPSVIERVRTITMLANYALKRY